MEGFKTALRVLFVFSLLFFFSAFHPALMEAAKPGKAAKAATAEPADKTPKANAAFDAAKMGDMSDFDPANPIIPTGDTIKIALVASFSGPGSLSGQVYWASALWAVHDINKRGGLLVDGKKKLVELIKADHMSKLDTCKKIVERMILQEKVKFLWGTNGGNMMKVINEPANKYKVIVLNAGAGADTLMDATNFTRYSFMTMSTTDQSGRGYGYYYGQIRKKEKKFYILNPDYLSGHESAEGFRKGLKENYPDAQIVGEDFYKIYLTDFVPYLEKIKASGAEVIFTIAFQPDAGNLLKQARQMGITLPFAHAFMDDPNLLHEIGIEGTKGLTQLSAMESTGNPYFKTPGQIKYYKTWNGLWKNKWKTLPYSSRLFEHGKGGFALYTASTYWLLSVIERAQSTDPEAIIKIWEGDTYQYPNGKIVKMRACDHKVIQDFGIIEFVPPAQQKASFNIPPYYWYKECSNMGPTYKIPAAIMLPYMDQKLDRCKGKNDWGE
jgi:branched-chain amino acid transport system substrate-binding protein